MTTWTQHGRGLGAVELTRQDPRMARYPAYGLVGAGVAPVRSMSMVDLVFTPPGYAAADQESSQACAGWQVTQCVYVRTKAMGIAPVAMSPDAVYYQARAARYGWEHIFDGGCNPLDAWASARQLGVVLYDHWPHVLKRKNDAPPADAYRHAADRKWLRYHWVLEEEAIRTAVVCGLLASRRPVGVVLTVDQGLEDWRPGAEPWTRRGAALGGHAVTLVGFDTLTDGRKVFLVVNSWGSAWGDCGVGLISQAALEARDTTYLVTPDIDGGA